MDYDLFIGDYAYSSWSLRGWLLFRRFGISARVTLLDFNKTSVREQLAARGAAGGTTVPAVLFDGVVVDDSIAIAEEMASRHPDAGFWPADPAQRAMARLITAEMHSGFGALRTHCPMNLRTAYSDCGAGQDVLDDVARISALWAEARALSGAKGPWLFGEYSIADAFYAPVAARIAGYSLPVDADAAAYVAAHLADPAFRRWRAMGFAAGDTLERYKRDDPVMDWPGPAPRAARAVEIGTAENGACPYSGLPVTHLMEMDGRIFGFCNAFCRDKTTADPEAWPAFMEIV